MTAEYELTLRVGPLSEEQVDLLVDEFDAAVHEDEAATTITVSGEGRNGTNAALALVNQLEVAGIVVQFVEKDLVNAAQIAQRAEVSRQTASNWIAGRRRGSGPRFPQHEAVAGGTELWRWPDVNTWLQQVGESCDDIEYLTRNQETVVDYRIETRKRCGFVYQDEWRASTSRGTEDEGTDYRQESRMNVGWTSGMYELRVPQDADAFTDLSVKDIGTSA